ncbi:MAG: recombinase family protein, partial [Gemmatimonadetes bacterium]|nr:recombinase family protein [Gemmatimonadota bacterium]
MEDSPVSTPVIAAAYLRSATGDPDQIASQLAFCRRYAERCGYTLSDEHVYRDAAGRGLYGDEPGWTWLAQMLSRTDDLRPTVLLVTELTRLGRTDPRLFEHVSVYLQKRGVRLECTTPGYTIHPADPADTGVRYILDSLEQRVREHERKVMARMLAKGR